MSRAPYRRGPQHGATKTDFPPWLEEARELYASGLSTVAVGKRVGVSDGTVSSWLRRAGVKIRRSGSSRQQT